jgi:hypothetical protein
VATDDESEVEVDAERTTALLEQFLLVVKTHVVVQPYEQARVLEVLNALAVSAATVVGAVAPAGVEECTSFFLQAFQEQVNLFLAQRRAKGPSQQPSNLH